MHEILGQDAAIGRIRSALAGGRMHHAWILHGPEGVGKFTTAMALARILLCHDATSDGDGHLHACGACTSCRLLDEPEAVHPDLHVITKELARFSNDATIRNRKLISIPIDIVREHLLDPAYHTVQLHHNKVFIVDEAHLLNQYSQNVMLKTLEEPPDGSYIFLVTAHEDRLLATIRSRCQRVAFGSLDDATVAAWLTDRLAEEPKVELSAAQRDWIVSFARGSLGRAQLAVDYDLHQWQEVLQTLLEHLPTGRPPTQIGTRLAELVDQFAAEWVKRQANASKEAANRAGVRHLLGLIGQMCRRQLAEQTAVTDSTQPAAAEARLQPYLTGIDLIHEADAQLEANVSAALLLDNLVIQWSRACARAQAG